MEQDKTSGNKPERDDKGRLLPGNTANPNGRPPGTSIKDRVRKYLEENPQDMASFVQHFATKNRELAWQMLEGRPQQDVTSGGEKLPTPLLHVFNNDGHKEDTQPEEEN